MDYNREAAVAYAHEWAMKRNKKYMNFSGIGGDCTNFISQCLLAGGMPMNFTRDTGWYYNSVNDRAPAWTGAEYLYRFLTERHNKGPMGAEVLPADLDIGDIIQISFDGQTYVHTVFVVDTDKSGAESGILIAAHTIDCDYRPFDTYAYNKYRCLKISKR